MQRAGKWSLLLDRYIRTLRTAPFQSQDFVYWWLLESFLQLPANSRKCCRHPGGGSQEEKLAPNSCFWRTSEGAYQPSANPGPVWRGPRHQGRPGASTELLHGVLRVPRGAACCWEQGSGCQHCRQQHCSSPLARNSLC